MWENLKSTVNNVIRPNDNREITGEKHNNTLSAVINSLGKYSQFAGLAFKNTNPGVPDGPVFYFAAFKGVYLNFNRIEVEENEVAILNYNNNKWEKIVIGYSPIAPATAEDIRLTALIDAVNSNNALKTNFEFKQDSIADVQLPFLHAAVSHIDADGQLIKGKPTSETLILVPLAEASTDADTPGKHGFMSYQDKDLLDSIPNYTISGKKISENPILTYDDIQGVAYLGEDGKIPSSLLPSYVDDVLEYDSIDNFPLIGEGGKIYLDKKTNLAYRWSGTVYVSISSSIALGETSSTAYAGDKGKKNADDIADLKANKADKTSVYTKEEVDYLIEHFKLPDHIKAITFSVDGILVSKNEDGNLVIGGNVIVEGGISMYGPGQFSDTIMDYIVVDGTSIKIIDGKLTVDPDFVGGGTVKGIKVNSYTYDEVDTNGYITIPDYPTELAWNSITGKPSTFTPSAHTHTIEDITDIANASVSHATTADRLKKEIKIWGQPFDGSTDVEGAISNVDVINMANADTVISLYIKDGVLFIEGDLAVTGGITMYASNGVASGMIDQVYAVLDPTIFSKQGDYITIKDDIGGGTVKAVKVGITQYDPDSDGIISLPEFSTATTVEWDNILNKPSSFTPSAHTHAISEISNLSSASVNYASSAGNASTSSLLALNTSPASTVGTGVGSWSPISDKVYVYRQQWTNTAAGSDSANLSICLDGTDANMCLDGYYYSVLGFKKYGSSDSYVLLGGGGHKLISDFATSSHTHSYLPLSGGTMTGDIRWATDSHGVYFYNGCGIEKYERYGPALVSEGNSTNFWIRNGTDITIRHLIFHDGNYTEYTVKKDGTGASGTWGISVTGNAATASNSDMLDGNHASAFATAGHTHTMLNTAFIFNNADITEESSNLANSATSHKITFFRNGFLIPYQMDDTHDGGMFRVRGTESDTICEIATWDDSGEGETIQFNYYPTTSTVTPTYSVSVPKASGTIALTSNLSAYLPLSGGTMTGTIYINKTIPNGTGLIEAQGAASHPTGFNHALCTYATTLDSGGHLIMVTGKGKSTYNASHFGFLNFSEGSPSNAATIGMWGCDDIIVANGDRRVGINTIYPNEALHVIGNILASGGITMYSDLRKKNILSDEVLSVKEIAAAPLFRHTYKSDENKYIHVGTSAQYWSGIHEDWFTRKDGEGYYQMELQNLGVAMGISLAREIVKYESKTDKKIRLMKKKINDLEARIKELEGSREERRTA